LKKHGESNHKSAMKVFMLGESKAL